MKFKNTEVGKETLAEFLEIVDRCAGGVYLRSVDGDNFNLKSMFSKYIAIGKLLSEHGDELELFCDNRSDESKFLDFFYNHQEVLKD